MRCTQPIDAAKANFISLGPLRQRSISRNRVEMSRGGYIGSGGRDSLSNFAYEMAAIVCVK